MISDIIVNDMVQQVADQERKYGEKKFDNTPHDCQVGMHEQSSNFVANV
jgi:hypothetical protein